MTHLPTRRMNDLIFRRVEYLLARPEHEVGAGKGLARAIHVAAYTERTFGAYLENDIHDGTPGFFSAAILEKIADRLRNAHLQPQESRFRDILDWRNCDKARLHDELRMNLLRLLRENPQPYGQVGIELHLILDMRVKFSAPGYLSAFEPADFVAHPQLGPMRGGLETHISRVAS